MANVLNGNVVFGGQITQKIAETPNYKKTGINKHVRFLIRGGGYNMCQNVWLAVRGSRPGLSGFGLPGRAPSAQAGRRPGLSDFPDR